MNQYLVQSRIPFKIIFFLCLLFLSGISTPHAMTVELQWDHNSDASHYIIYWDTISHPPVYANQKQISGGLTTDTIDTATDETTYFSIKAFNSFGNASEFSEEITKTDTSETECISEKIIDNGDTGTIANGTWPVSSGPQPYGTDSLYSLESGATYTYEATLNCCYQVSLWWTTLSSRYNAVPVEIYDGDTLIDTIIINQQENGGQWNVLGTYNFTGTAKVIIVSMSDSLSTSADSVKFGLSGECDPPANDPPVNNPPVLNPIGSKTVSEGTLLQFTLTANDTDGNTLSYSAESLPPGAAFDSSTGFFSWTPDSNTAGTYQVIFIVTDNGSPQMTDTEEITITVTGETECISEKIIDNGDTGTIANGTWPVSSGPQPYGTNSLYSLESGATYTYEATLNCCYQVSLWWTTLSSRYNAVPVEIYDGDTLIDTIIINQQENGGQWNVLGTYNFTGTAKVIIVSMSDSLSTSADSVKFGLSGECDPPVNDPPANDPPVNNPPVLNPIGSKTVSEGTLLQFTLTANDTDGNTLSYSAESLPPGATLDSSTGLFSWTPDSNAAGTYQIIFTVTDNGSPQMTDTEEVTITVTDVSSRTVSVDLKWDLNTDASHYIIYWDTVSQPPVYANQKQISGSLTAYTINTATDETTYFSIKAFNSYGNSSDFSTEIMISGSSSIPANTRPILNPIGSKTVTENQLLSFTLNANDPDGDAITYSAGNLPPDATFNTSTRTFSWIPGFETTGNYQVIFTASDNGTPQMTDSETVTITVGNTNRPPVLNAIGPKTITENQTISFTVTASDPDGNALSFSTGDMPTGAVFNGSTGSFSWTPDYSATGNYQIIFTVTDDSSPSLNDTETVSITVGNTNRPPVLNTIGAKSINENEAINFTITASDPDGDAFVYTASNLPTGAAFNNQAGTFSWTPGFDSTGNYQIVFTATDNGSPVLSHSETVTLTVGNVNRPPVLASIGSKTTSENTTLEFSLSASDPDNDSVSFTAGNLPTGAVFNTGTGNFSWTPDFEATGNYQILFTTQDSGTPPLNDSETVTITVGDVNRAPVLNPIGARTILENQLLTFTVAASDPDGDAISYSTGNLPVGALFNIVTGTFSWTPGFDVTGSYPVVFTITDSGSPPLSVSETVTISVGNTNRPPVFSTIGTKSIGENELLQFTLSASDPDGDKLVYSSGNMPEGALFDAETGTFSWTPGFDTMGNYQVVFTVTDSGLPQLSSSESVTITVGNINRPPELNTIGSKSINESQTLSFTVTANDPDGDKIVYSTGDMPTGADFNVTSGLFTWVPDFDATGNYQVIFTATDDGTPLLSDSETITITVGNINRPPVMNLIGAKETVENEQLKFTISASDPDGDSISYTAGNIPDGAVFEKSTGTFTWTPDFNAIGNYQVLFTVSDSGVPVLNDTETVAITIGNVNRPPVLNSIGSKTVEENQELIFTAYATDPDGDIISLSGENLPPGAAFDADTGTFNWIPGFDSTGNYQVVVSATDNGTPPLSMSETVAVTVGNTNRPPILNTIGAMSTLENQMLQFTIMASDPDGDPVTFMAGNLPTGALFNTETGSFSWTPDYDATGNYPVIFTTSDNGTPVLSTSESVTITVGNVNRPPVLNSVGPKSINEGEFLGFTITANDPDSDKITYSAGNMPPGAAFNTETASFSWIPGFTATGSYQVIFTGSDTGTPVLSDSKTITITVGNTNRPPAISPTGDKNTVINKSLTFTISAQDPDGDELFYSSGNMPTGATLDSNTGTFNWTPGNDAAGNYQMIFTATDSGTPKLSDSETTTITVGRVNKPPVLNTLGAKSVNENQEIRFTLSASDPDGDELAYSAGNLPAGSAFTDSTGTFSWTPGFDKSGNYQVLFTVTDNGSPFLNDSETVIITVGNVNRSPELNTIGSKAMSESGLLLFTATATDPDGDPIIYSAENLPPGASFNQDSGAFAWAPDYTSSGNYQVIISATDNGTPQLSMSETVDITVGNTNRPPILNDIGAKGILENETLHFSIMATDPDGDPIEFTADNLPTGALFDSSSGTFDWTPDYHSFGNYQILFTVIDNGEPLMSDHETITVTVGNVNRAPVLNEIGVKDILENQPLEFTVNANDPDGDLITYSAGYLPTGALFDTTTGVFTWTPAFDATGNYKIAVTATDNGTPALGDLIEFTINVGNVNRPPVLTSIGTKSTIEGEPLTFTVNANDPDGNMLTYTASGLPPSSTFNSQSGTFSWIPGFNATGSYRIVFTVSDNGVPVLSDSQAVTLTVGNVNRPPVLSTVGSKIINENEILEFNLMANDPDGDTLVYSAGNLPSGVSLDPATGFFSWIPAYNQTGNYQIVFTVTDTGSPVLNDSETITLTVGNVNRPPSMSPIGAKTIDENQVLEFYITASDPDGETLTYDTSDLPEGAEFTTGTGYFNWKPDFNTTGNYLIRFTATDTGSPRLSAAEDVTITVGQINRPPILTPIGAKIVAENETLNFNLVASDPDGDSITYTVKNLPQGATFSTATGNFLWTPTTESIGNYWVTFGIVDNGSPPLTEEEEITITAGDVNRPPALNFFKKTHRILFKLFKPKAFTAQATTDDSHVMEFSLYASDPEGNALSYSIDSIPDGAQFDPFTGKFLWNTKEEDSGTYQIQYTVTDNGSPPESDTEIITLIVKSLADEVPVTEPKEPGEGDEPDIPDTPEPPEPGDGDEPGTPDTGDGEEPEAPGEEVEDEFEGPPPGDTAPETESNPSIEVFDNEFNHQMWLKIDWLEYNDANGEARVATGDIDGDGEDEVIIGMAPYQVDSSIPGGFFEILDDDYTHLAWGRVNWSNYNELNGETWPTCGDVDGDGTDEIIIGLGAGGEGSVEIFDYDPEAAAVIHKDWVQVDWEDYNQELGETRPRAGDIDGDGADEIIVGLGSAKEGTSIQNGQFEIIDDDFTHLAWGEIEWPDYNTLNGESWASIGDLDGDKNLEIIIGLGEGGDGRIELFDFTEGTVSHRAWAQLDWSEYNQIHGETRPAIGDIDSDGFDEIIVGLGPVSGDPEIPMGYFQIIDNDYSTLQWGQIDWNEFNQANGESRPVSGTIRADKNVIIGLGPLNTDLSDEEDQESPVTREKPDAGGGGGGGGCFIGILMR